ncbi:MAG: SDR family NAD(P)-dependent oxidoreductase, partial [Gammaproteobacteria bacterium]|nr:SDR family NAD(P)-dependent oxidoreductase [Gammaproteobacteria bacterium]
MNLGGKKVILTGATGGIGQEVAQALVAKGTWVLLVGRNQVSLSILEKSLKSEGYGSDRGVFSVSADVSVESQRQHIVEFAHGAMGGVDILINLAGAMSFTEFSEESLETTEQLFQSNVIAPMQLSRLLLPEMVEQGSGNIVNVGSIFGSIAFAWFTTYSSTKYALRGFSEALRRELVDTGVEVTYIAPRAVSTPFNSERMME